MNNNAMYLITADWCAPCTKTKSWVGAQGIPELEILDISEDYRLIEALKQSCGIKRIPSIPSLLVVGSDPAHSSMVSGSDLIIEALGDMGNG